MFDFYHSNFFCRILVLESCYHPVLRIQYSCENPPTDFLKPFVFHKHLRKFFFL